MLAGQAQCVVPGMRHQRLETAIARQIAHHAGVVRIILHDQQHRIAVLHSLAVIGNVVDPRGYGKHWHRERRSGIAGTRQNATRATRADVLERQEQRKGAAAARHAL